MGSSSPPSVSDSSRSGFGSTLPKWPRRILSLWLLYHVAAIASSPLVVPPSSDLFRLAARAFRPYLQALYLNHGYHYFAPEPGESTLIAFTVERDDGTTVRGIIPHRDIRPRLLYHRHFMLTESLAYIPDDLLDAWHESYARCIARRHNGRSVTLTQVQHYLPSPQMVLEGVTLDNPASFVETPLGVYQREEGESQALELQIAN